MTNKTPPQLDRKVIPDFNKGLHGAAALRPSNAQPIKKPLPQPAKKE